MRGDEGSDASGSVDTTVAVAKGGTLAVNGGTVTVANTTVEDGSVNVNGGAASFGNLTVSGDATIATAEEAAATQVDKLTLGGGSITITGALQAGGLALAEVPADSYQVNIGTTGEDGKAGKLALHTDTLAGASYFLDPVYVDGQDVSEGSSLKYAGTKVDGSVVVGENSYAVFGSTDDAALLDVFKKGHLTWGNGEGEVLSAVYVAAPIAIDAAAGGLKADGTINQGSADKTVVAGAVHFAANSALVADVSGLTADTALITADSVTVEEGSKAVVIGDLKQNIGYMLTTDLAQNQNWANNLVSGNAL